MDSASRVAMTYPAIQPAPAPQNPQPRQEKRNYSKTGRRQNRSCDQCRKGKRACDAALLDHNDLETALSPSSSISSSWKSWELDGSHNSVGNQDTGTYDDEFSAWDQSSLLSSPQHNIARASFLSVLARTVPGRIESAHSNGFVP
jgi:hypothetical protein